MDAPPDNLELFSTIRLLVSPRRDQIKIPYISLHGQRISDGLQAFATAGTPQQQATGDVWAEGIEQAVRGEVNALSNDSWTARLESAQGHVSLHFRFKFSVKLADQTFRAELFPLPAPPSGSEPTFCSELGQLVPQPSSSRPRVVLSTKPLDVTASESIYLLQKTSKRDVYDQHQSLGAQRCPSAQSTLLFVDISSADTPSPSSDYTALLTETTIANVLFLPPNSSRWITPRLSAATPFLPGLARRHLLMSPEADVLERDVSVAEAKRWLAEGGRIVCCNALRGVWEVDVVWE